MVCHETPALLFMGALSAPVGKSRAAIVWSACSIRCSPSVGGAGTLVAVPTMTTVVTARRVI
jgi:hypothetical protein